MGEDQERGLGGKKVKKPVEVGKRKRKQGKTYGPIGGKKA